MIYIFRTNDGVDLKLNLIPCPFCGSAPEVKDIGNSRTKVRSVTIGCKTCRFFRKDSSRGKSIMWLADVSANAWNRRKESEVTA